MESLRVLMFACVALLQFHKIVSSPILIQAGQIPSDDADCRIEIMDKVEHKTFYEYCSSFEDAEVNIPRTSVYFAKNELYSVSKEIFMEFFRVLNMSSTPVSPACLGLLKPFLCFYYFKFPLTDNCADGYLPPCKHQCELTHETCQKDFQSLVEQGLADPDDLQHLSCTNFKETKTCVSFPSSVSTEAATNDLATEPVATDSPATETTEAEAPVECDCAKKVRQNVTKRMIMDPDYTLAAQVSVLALREEGEGSEKHVVYDVIVHKEYQISCRPPVQDDTTTTVHMETPMVCLEGDHGCRAMTVGNDHRYLVVGTTTSDGKWLLRDSKGSGGCAISDWIPKYEKMDKWAAKSVPSQSTCTRDSGLSHDV